jgi:capsular polysaccharide biosynthesis protein
MSESVNKDEDVISLKDLILSIQEYWKEIWKYKFLIIGCAILFSVLLVVKAVTAKSTYKADLTFMINDEEGGGGLNGISAILGSFGLDGGGGDGQNLDKIIQLSKARKISQIAFFEKVDIKGNKDYLANHIINYQDSLGRWFKRPFYKFWGKTSVIKDFRFTQDSVPLFNKNENLALKVIHLMVAGNEKFPGLTTTSYNEESGIMTISTNSLHPDIAYELTQQTYNALYSYYIKNSIEKQRVTYDLVKFKTDSIKESLRADEYALASLKDSRRATVLTKDKLLNLRLEGRIKMGYAALAKALENLEIADFTLKNKTPFIQVIDEPLKPLLPVKPSFLKALIFGGILGGMLSIAFILLRKIFRDTMSSV